MFSINGTFKEHFTNDLNGLYSFDILMYRLDLEEDTIVQRHSVSGQTIQNNYIKEFSVFNLDDIGMRVRFVVFDNTTYLPGMQPLAILAWLNNNTDPIMVRFDLNTSNNTLTKRKAFDAPNFKSCVFEFDTAFMKNKLLI